ncbi:amidase signature domain-containing protein [Hyaloraphidium curvatum]|nr:amidase signature domain-containing protein [Hyaloraphidium curvatum]
MPTPTHHGGVHLMDLSAAELADLVNARAVSPVRAVLAAFERIDALDPVLNAFVVLRREGALADAEELGRRLDRDRSLKLPLAGVPLGVKDLEDVAGLPTSHGCAIWKDHMPRADSVHVARLRRAGCIVVGKTAAPSLGFTAWTFSNFHGVTRNPWDPSRTPGGSSGGTSAAIAARMVPLSTASDGGGSIRGPACWTGCFGFKGSYGRVPLTGDPPFPAHRHLIEHAHNGPITRTVLDAALFLDACAGYHPLDPSSLPAPGIKYADVVRSPPARRLRIAFSRTLGIVPGVDAEVLRGVERACAALAALGHRVEESAFALPKLGRTWSVGAGGNSWVTAGEAIRGREGELDAMFVDGIKGAEGIGIADLAGTLRRFAEFAGAIAEGFFPSREEDEEAGYDALVTPAMPFVAPAAMPEMPKFIGGVEVRRGADGNATDFWGFSMPFNFNGNPACVMRCGLSESGLPLSFQIVGRKHEDHVLFALAAEYEKATGCFDTWPEVKTGDKAKM